MTRLCALKLEGMRHPQLKDAKWLAEQYVGLGKSSIVIASEIGCSPSRVQSRLREAGIGARGRWSGRWSPKDCERCAGSFVPSGPAQRFCSPECRAGTGTCEQCGAEFQLTPPTNPDYAVYQRRFCSPECHAAWRAKRFSHRYLNEDGYVVVVRPPTESSGLNDNGYVRVNLGTGRHGRGRVLEHRLVMERQLGRSLLPGETVHHKNTVKTDNDPGNLELWSTSHPKGGRVKDKIEWALEFLAQYGEVQFRSTTETISFGFPSGAGTVS